MSNALGTHAALAERTRSNEAFFAAEADRLARLCHRMAERFARGGRLIAFGGTPAARSDAHHVAVEFVHPVIVGKRALPALAVTGDERLAHPTSLGREATRSSQSRHAPTPSPVRALRTIVSTSGCTWSML